ncbi:hypothetical protein BASA81_004209 [Batrachochytrium salamandrivorans]|nr:hypothetical protein BASA81_004209 [Batrachochytrium salamandrivorans]
MPPTSALFKFEIKTKPLVLLVLLLCILPVYFTALQLTSRVNHHPNLYPVIGGGGGGGGVGVIGEEENEVVFDEEEVDNGEEKEVVPSPVSNKPAVATQFDKQAKEDEEAAIVVDEVDDVDEVTPQDEDIVLLESNGCEFGWHSPSLHSPSCFHVVLSPMVIEEANQHCAQRSPGSELAKITSLQEATFICQALERSNNRLGQPGEVHLGLMRNPFESSQGHFFRWRDGSKPDVAVAPLLPSERMFTKVLSAGTVPTITLPCGKANTPWNIRADEPMAFVCSKLKPKSTVSTLPTSIDSTWNEEADSETNKWTKVADFTNANCPATIQHLNPSLASLPMQISWKLTDYTPKSESKRYYLVWQSKGWFGWLDFWVDYLVRYRDFKGAPVGKYVTSSRAASEHLGWSNVFSNPLVPQKYGSSLTVFSRLPIPENILVYFPQGTLVNQVYYDPFARVPLGDKLELSMALDTYQRTLKHPCNLQVTPDTFDISQPQACLALRQRVLGIDSKANWIIKGPYHGGAAIAIATGPQVLKRLGDCSPSIIAKLVRKHEIVQRLIDSPLLLDGRKFDLRVFVLIASTKPLLVYVHREPYFRAAMRKYNGLEKNRHVTNTHIQKTKVGNFSDKEWAEHIWTLDRVSLLADKAGLSENFFMDQVFPQIKRSIQIVLQSSASSLVHRRHGQWKLFGVDFVIDANLQPFLLDWNSFPGWDWSYRLPWTLDYRRRILGDSWRLVLDVQRGRAISDSKSTPRSGGFELVYHTK